MCLENVGVQACRPSTLQQVGLQACTPIRFGVREGGWLAFINPQETPKGNMFEPPVLSLKKVSIQKKKLYLYYNR
jgi:hypothetical protein